MRKKLPGRASAIPDRKQGSYNLSTKQELITDIEKLLNSYDGEKTTHINPDLLSFMDEQTLKSIIESLLEQKEKTVESNHEWLEQFKKY
jgi:hypothetical protein